MRQNLRASTLISQCPPPSSFSTLKELVTIMKLEIHFSEFPFIPTPLSSFCMSYIYFYLLSENHLSLPNLADKFSHTMLNAVSSNFPSLDHQLKTSQHSSSPMSILPTGKRIIKRGSKILFRYSAFYISSFILTLYCVFFCLDWGFTYRYVPS